MTMGEQLKKDLNSIMPGSTIVYDEKPTGVVDAELLISKTLPVVQQGTSGSGFAAWATVRTEVGTVGFVAVHASRTRRIRATQWEWLKAMLDGDSWIVLGDFNMVENRRDTIGDSPMMRDAELRQWTILDQARLDRCYLTNRGQWLHTIPRMIHFGESSLADHIPVQVQPILKSGGDRRIQTKSYFKMDAAFMKSPEVLETIKRTWEEHPGWAKDAQNKWYLALGRVRTVFQSCREKQKSELPEAIVIQANLAKARRDIQESPTEDNKNRFEEALKMARRREQADSRICRIRSRIKWINEGDSPSKFFFASLRAKQSYESIVTIKLDSGELITEEETVRTHVLETYEDLYTEVEDTWEQRDLREEKMQLIDKKLTAEQNRVIAAALTDELIEEVVRSLPSDKAPGIDGVTAEVLVAGWSFMRSDCLAMVKRVWSTGNLLQKDNRGVIKLIPKNSDKYLLKNWRPITLLTTTYKIIAKIIAWRLKTFLPGIIDQQQTGFIAGRNIVENVLSLRLAQDWVLETNQNVMFVKLDFQKAYDMVSHTYLWTTLKALGMCTENLKRIQGIVRGGSSQIQINGCLTEKFAVGRGVRQGCPLAPLMFAMSTQQLMRMLREEEAQGRLKGVCYGGEQTLLHQIYADDTGINVTMDEGQFRRLTVVIEQYELIAGAKLNMTKSLIMPLGPGTTPDWVRASGCEIAEEEKAFYT
ncbi:hypothetical protein R1sor_005479 [Riccia sorocarpa]|uniref:Reverse transcriptase domain-containing protein n=1 Tax=Riccia sorocarpa TaxID=122646 RepID=A0ABD3HKB7_9MARC